MKKIVKQAQDVKLGSKKKRAVITRKQTLSDYWRKLYSSTKNSMSRGAQNIATTIRWARNENWRRMDRKMKKPKKK